MPPQLHVAVDGELLADLRDATVPAEHLGSKAANLRTAATAGLPVLPGFVVTTHATERLDDHEVRAALVTAWRVLTQHGVGPVVVRSSSPAEDTADASQAGVFTSVLGVDDETAFLDAVERVVASGVTPDGLRVPMAVLVQPEVRADVGGVLFGVDPTTGRRDRLVVAASDLGPDGLVSGADTGTTYVLNRRGRCVRRPLGATLRLGGPLRRALADLAARVEALYGQPQDVEWLVARGRLHLLQARPVTAVSGPTSGPVLGPGPVAETFPDPLSPLEQDLWVAPLRDGLRDTLYRVGTPRRRVAASPVVTVIDDRVAVDLRLLGADRDDRSAWVRLIDPRPAVRRLRTSWRVGALRADAPDELGDLVRRTDATLAAVPHLSTLDDRALVGLVEGSQPTLRRLHAGEILAGLLVRGDAAGASAAGAALAALADARADGGAADVVADHPVVLALAPPRVGGPTLPTTVPTRPAEQDDGAPRATDPMAILREQLRLRARWVQELQARAVTELGRRLAARGELRAGDEARWLRLAELGGAVEVGALAPEVRDRGGRRAAAPPRQTSPLPERFRLDDRGRPVPVRTSRRGARTQGVSGGYAEGRVHRGPNPPPGSVLVTDSLAPSLAADLARCVAVVAGTGSVLSHLAILAREQGIPVVVGVADLGELPDGALVAVDGTAGRVEVLAQVGA